MATVVGWQRPLVPGRGAALKLKLAEPLREPGSPRVGAVDAGLRPPPGLRGQTRGVGTRALHRGSGLLGLPLLQAPRDRV